MSKQNKPQQVEQDVLLVKDHQKNKIQAVKAIDDNGNLQTTSATKANQAQFMRVDKNGDFFTNFISNFTSQLKNPAEFTFFKVPELLTVKIANQMQKELNAGDSNNQEVLSKYLVKVSSEKKENNKTQERSLQQQPNSSYKFDIKDMDWSSLSKLGFSKEKLEELNLLEPLLKGYKTKDLVAVNVDLGAAVFTLDARLSLQNNKEGKVVMALEGVRKYANLNDSLFGHEFSRQDKHNLLKTGNMGRVVELIDPSTGGSIPSIVSVDRLTNNLMVTSVEKMDIPLEIKGVVLSQDQRQTLFQGKALFLEGMTSVNGNLFVAEIQFNAAKGHIEFLFDRTNSRKQNHNGEHDKSQQVSNPKVFRGKELDKAQYEKLMEGKTVYIDGLVDRKGQSYQGYITHNKETNKTSFTFQNPTKVNEKTIPDESIKTQVAVNSQDKTNQSEKQQQKPVKETTVPNKTKARKI